VCFVEYEKNGDDLPPAPVRKFREKKLQYVRIEIMENKKLSSEIEFQSRVF